jgi:2-dehydro-3-deoxygluconokinase
MPDLITLGECMVELYCDGTISQAAQFSKAFGGDTLNTAVAASRLGSHAGFISKFGDDPFAPFLNEELQREGIDLSCCPTIPGMNGLCVIGLGEKGERELIYYRTGSAASTLTPDDLKPDYLQNTRLVHSSGISQAISPSCRRAVQKAFELARAAGVRTSFDPNYRARLWSAQEAREALDEIIPLTDIFLPSAPDETQTLLQLGEPAAIHAWAEARGVQISVFKQGNLGCVVASEGELKRVESLRNARGVDTSDAGDAFNGGFLHGLLHGLDPVEAARLGVATAGLTVEGRGAVRSLPDRRRVADALQDEPWAGKILKLEPGLMETRSGTRPVAYIDGGARGNPGPAGAGVHIELEGQPWRGLYTFLGEQTNNFAEYSALLIALEFALKEGFRELAVYSDSELLVRQILGRYRVKNPSLRVLHEKATDLIRRFKRFGIQHVRREENWKADALVNKALDLRQSGEDHYQS